MNSRPPLPTRYGPKPHTQTCVYFVKDHGNEPYKMKIGAYLGCGKWVTLYVIAHIIGRGQ